METDRRIKNISVCCILMVLIIVNSEKLAEIGKF